MTCLEIENGVLIRDPKIIMNEQIRFYTELYKDPKTYRRANLLDFVQNVQIPKLSVDDSLTCDGPILYQECYNAVKGMRNDASPGLDGLTGAFYKVFWSKINEMVVKSVNDGYIKGQLSCTQREGVMTLLPKKDSPRKFLKN